jgi:hypothetical protein
MKETVNRLIDESDRKIISDEVHIERTGTEGSYIINPMVNHEILVDVLESMFEDPNVDREDNEVQIYLPIELEANMDDIEGTVMLEDVTSIFWKGNSYPKTVVSYEGDGEMFDSYVEAMNRGREKHDEFAQFDSEREAWLVGVDETQAFVDLLEEAGFEVGKSASYRAKEEIYGEEAIVRQEEQESSKTEAGETEQATV